MASKKTYKTKTRRANNEGSIFQRKDGLWTGSITLGYDDNGKIKRKVVYGKTRLEVANKVAEITNRISNDNYDLVSNNSLSTLMKEWLLVFKKTQVTARTFENNFRHFNLYIEPKIGGMKLDEITSITIQKLLNEMLEQKLSLDYVKKTKFLLRQFFEYAVDNKLLVVNPVDRTKVRSNERKIYDGQKESKAIPIEAREEFIECLNNNDFLKPLCLTMMFAGLRSGEVLALQWQDIDFENKTISIERGLTIEPKFNSEGKVIKRVTIISDTKTACSKRVVPMPDILINALNDYKLRQAEISNKRKVDLLDKHCFVFANDDGSFRTYSGTQKIFDRFLKKYNLTQYNIHFHGLRHTYSNMLFEADQNPKVIQNLLGHKDVKTTISTYNSIDKSYFEKATNVLNEQFKENDNEKIVEQIKDDDIDKIIEMLQKRKQQELEQEEYEREQKKKKKQSDMEM